MEKNKEIYTVKQGLKLSVFAIAFFMCSLFSHSAEAAWQSVEKVEGQCFSYKSIDAVGELFIYTEEKGFNFVLASESPLTLSGEDDLVALIKKDGFADYFEPKQFEDDIVNFSVPLSYFEKNDYRDIASVFFYVDSKYEKLIPFDVPASIFAALSACEGLYGEEEFLDNPVFFNEEDVAEAVIEEERSPYDFSRLPSKNLPDAELEHEQTLEYTKTQEKEDVAIAPEDRDVPFFEEVQRHMQKNIFIPVESRVSEADITLDEQLEIIDSLTEKIKLLEVEKEFLRKKLDSTGDELINVVADSSEKP